MGLMVNLPRLNGQNLRNAPRDINHLLERSILKKDDAGGRSTRYYLVLPK